MDGQAKPALDRRTATSRSRFKDINFGAASADWEASHEPELVRNGFLDPMSLVSAAREGSAWLFLGYKGSGKSSLGEHLRLLSQEDPELFVHFENISDVSFSTFSQIMKGGPEPEARYPSVWSWLLLVFVLDSFSKDQGALSSTDDDFCIAVEALRELGLLPEPKLGDAVLKTSEKSFSIKLTSIFGGIEAGYKGTGSREVPDLPFFVERLRQIARRFKTENRHLIVIDGFDDLLRRGNLQYDALGALIFEANRLNMDFAGAGVKAKIVILCRTDLFERLPGANKNKIRQNAAISIDWSSDPRDPASSNLLKLLNHRAKLSLKQEVDVFEQFLPPRLGPRQGNDLRSQLLDNTRQVPRDIVMLFKKLQEYSGDSPMTETQIFNALTAYSRDYLLPEIKDELDGYVAGEDIARIFQIVGSIRKTTFRMRDLQDHAKTIGVGKPLSLNAVLDAMFECSAIGNVPAPSPYPVFKYRVPHARLNPDERLIVHRGLWRALNLND